MRRIDLAHHATEVETQLGVEFARKLLHPAVIGQARHVQMSYAAIAGGERAAALPAGILVKAWLSVGLWTLAPLAGALAWFRRQDLSKE